MDAPLLLIGATGQIGRNIVARAAGRPLVALARNPDRVGTIENVVAHQCELTAPIGDIPGGPTPEAIVTAPVWLLPAHLDALRDAGVRRLVCFSTTSVLGKAETGDRHERTVVDRVASAERALRDWAADTGVGLTILRPTLIYGAGQDRTVTAAARFIRRFGVYPVWGPANGLRQPVHADDLAAAALAALASPAAAGRTYALGGGETLAYREMISRIFAALGRGPRCVRVPGLPALLAFAGAVIPGSELTADVARRMNMDLDFDDGAATADFGYAPRAFLAGGRADLFGADT